MEELRRTKFQLSSTIQNKQTTTTMNGKEDDLSLEFQFMSLNGFTDEQAGAVRALIAHNRQQNGAHSVAPHLIETEASQQQADPPGLPLASQQQADPPGPHLIETKASQQQADPPGPTQQVGGTTSTTFRVKNGNRNEYRENRFEFNLMATPPNGVLNYVKRR